MRVTLSTLHGAKGLECDTVVIVGFDAEHLAHRRTVAASADGNAAVEEERRLGLRIRNPGGRDPNLVSSADREIRALLRAIS